MSINAEKLEKIKVLVVDDHTLFAEGTVSLLSPEPRIMVVGIAKNGQECISMISKTEADVVLLDINLPDTSGTDLIKQIKKVKPAVKIIMLTGHNPKGYVTDSISKGANGFLLKNCSGKEMIQAIFKVYEGSIYFSQSLKASLKFQNNEKGYCLQGHTKEIVKLLTTKETKIMELVSQGLHNKEIASKLSINVRTVDFHVSNILVKLGANNRFEAVLRWSYIDEVL